MSKLVLAFTCTHSEPETSNERFDWLGKFIYDIKPDAVWDLGDGAEMGSLSSFDNAKPGIIMSRNYEADIDSYGDSRERIWHKFSKQKRKRPARFGLQGNHEYRIEKAVEANPRLHGKDIGINPDHLEPSRWFDEYHSYVNGAPAIATWEGVNFAHYVSNGNFGSALSGEHHAYNLLKKMMRSTVVGHSHKLNVYFRPEAKAIGAVIGCYKGGATSWAGQANSEWWKGVMLMHNLKDGWYDPQFISQEQLRKEYGN